MSARPERWWDGEFRDELETRVWNVVDRLWKNQGIERASDADDYLTLYFGNARYGLRGYRAGFVGGFAGLEAPGYNVIQSCTDTAVAHTVKNRVRPFFLTEKGDAEAREKAQGMTKAAEGVLRDIGMYGTTALDLCFHGHLFDGGVLIISPDYANNRVLGECVDPWKILIPEREAQTRNPRQFFYRDRIDRSVLLDQFKDEGPEVIEAIESAPAAPHDEALDASDSGDGDVSDLVEFAQCWHLPSGRVDRKKKRAFGMDDDDNFDPDLDPGHDGLFAIVIRGQVLRVEPWAFPYPPLIFFLPLKRPNHHWSRGIPETLLGAQLAIHRMNQRVDGIMHLHARPLLYVWQQAKVSPGKITNDYATIIVGSQPAGQAIQYITPQAVPAEYIARIDRIIDWAKEQVGIPDTSIQANRPAGIEHAPALQFLADVESIRHTPKFQAWEEVYVQAARRIVDVLRLLAIRKPDFEVIWGDAKDMARIKWADVDLDDDKFLIKVWPTNLLPQTPQAKIARLIEMIRNKIIPPEMAVQALDYPDIEAILGDANAALRNIQNKIDALVHEGDEVKGMAHPYLDLLLAKRVAKERLNALEADGFDDERLDLVRTFLEDVDGWLLKAEADKALAAQGIAPNPTDPNAPPDGGIPAPLPGDATGVEPPAPALPAEAA